ncbi:hypothetical protein TWF506_004664 [Arthrobotrys conoides]|uniref:C2H2-type domain-containing protein n=1 Tax=Arthrobotrys conoides TaxID=74498 RepID=A0AAN8N022_9PEZI
MGLELLVEADDQMFGQPNKYKSTEDNRTMDIFGDEGRDIDSTFDNAIDWGFSDAMGVDSALKDDLQDTWLFPGEVPPVGLSDMQFDKYWYSGSADRNDGSSSFLEAISDSGPGFDISMSQLDERGWHTNPSRYAPLSERNRTVRDYQDTPSTLANAYLSNSRYGTDLDNDIDIYIDPDLLGPTEETNTSFWDDGQHIGSTTLDSTTPLPPIDEFIDFNPIEAQSLQVDPVPPTNQIDTAAPDEALIAGPSRRAPCRPAGQSSTTAIQPVPRPGRRPYKENRQRIPLERVRRRMKCNIDGCEYEYATPGTMYRHRKNTHWSKSEFCARCLYPGCTAELWAGTGPKAWDNLKTHQNHKHAAWISGKTKWERCEMTEHSRGEDA